MAHILLIEPDRLLGALYERALVYDGHTVKHVIDAQEAVFAADDHAPDVVVLELQLIGHSGIEFLYEFRSYVEWQDIPVIIVSQVPPHELRHSQNLLREQLGVTGYYYKITMRLFELRQIVAAAVRS